MKITLIDTFGFLFRNYYAIPPYLKTKSGFPTNMLTGFMNFITSLGRDFDTDYVVFSLDSEGKSFRNEIYDKYKANRKEAPEDLKKQLPVALKMIEEMGFHNIKLPKYESDDIIASLATKLAKEGFVVQIVSHDKDMYQLIDDDKIVIFDPIKKEIINEQKCIEKFGVMPKDFVDFQAIVGDSADNVPGAKGIGVKGAEKLINEYHTIENIYANIDNIKGAMKKKLIESKDNVFLSKKLVTLKKDLFDDKEINLEEFKYPEINPVLKIADMLMEYELHRVIDRVKKDGLFMKTIEPKKEYKFLTLNDEKELFEKIAQIKDIVAFDIETDSLDKNANLVGFSFAYDEVGYYVPVGHKEGININIDTAIKAIKEIFKHKIIGHNLKFDLGILLRYDIKSDNYFDTMILAWIVNPDRKVGLDVLVKEYIDYDMTSFKDVVPKNKNFSDIEIQTATKYAAEDALFTFKLYFKLLEELKDKEYEFILDEVEDVEFPFIYTLIEMERRGIKVDIEYLKLLENKLNEKLSFLTENIYKLSGEEFNINSTKQLAEVLFEKLKLPTKKKTKTGYSTNEKVLLSLKGKHEIIDYILEYRTYYKLNSTYIKPLFEYASLNKENIVYTNFLQTGTATGRLSSKDPNLQNIPVNKDINIRDAFVAREGKKLVSLDYSQIELRLLAHFSEDDYLVDAFKNDKDIHLETATKIFGENAKEYRSIAKSINFGLIYGMGSKKLSETINVSTKEAKEFIEKYFSSFPNVKQFLETQKQIIKSQGYVETLLKRRRFFDFSSANAFMQSNFEREAINTKFQGSAADLIKLAMLEIDKLNIDMLLQIHDELIFEIDEDKLDIVDNIKDIMENIYELKVPLKVGISYGKRWGELK